MNRELEMAKLACRALDEKKGKDIKVIDIHEVSVIADYFVIANGTSSTQVKSLADEVEYQIGEKQGIKPANIEGRGQGNWVLLDYENVIVHVFNPQTREFYNLEKLWAECEKVEFE